MTTNNPMAVVVTADIDFHTVLKAVAEFAKKYPIERLSATQARELTDAAKVILTRLEERRDQRAAEERCPRFVTSNTPKHFCINPARVAVKKYGSVIRVCIEHLHEYLENDWKELGAGTVEGFNGRMPTKL